MTADLSQLTDLITTWAALALTAWVLVAVAVGWLADQKGRSPVIWFLVGLLTAGWTLLMLVFSQRRPSSA